MAVNSDRYVGNLSTDVFGILADEARIAHLQLTALEAASASATAVHAAVTGSGSAITTVTTAITNPPYPRNIVITPGGTTADVAACSITVTGTDMANEVISEDIAFLANATAASSGVKAFKTVTSMSIPIQDGAAATFAFGFGELLGLPFKFTVKPLVFATDDGAIETTAPVITPSATVLSANVIDLNTGMNGSIIDIYIVL